MSLVYSREKKPETKKMMPGSHGSMISDPITRG
jgi:hypothetical protein